MFFTKRGLKQGRAISQKRTTGFKPGPFFNSKSETDQTYFLIPVIIRFEGSFNRNTDIIGLTLVKYLQLNTDFGQV